MVLHDVDENALATLADEGFQTASTLKDLVAAIERRGISG